MPVNDHQGGGSPSRSHRRDDAGADPAMRLVAAIAAEHGAPEPEPPAPPPGPTYWPTVTDIDAVDQWEDLAGWVAGLQARFETIDNHVIPPCWWRHNGHVETLAALRDHEGESYAPVAPASAAVGFMRALRDVTAILRAWTAEIGCAGGHYDSPPPPPGPARADWDAHVAADVARRAAEDDEDDGDPR